MASNRNRAEKNTLEHKQHINYIHLGNIKMDDIKLVRQKER